MYTLPSPSRTSPPPSSFSSSPPLLTSTQATISLIKGIAGAGSFALPFAFSQSGLLAGLLALALLAFLSSSSIKLLASIKRSLFGSATVTYLDLGERVLGEDAAHLITAAVCACSLGVSTAYLDFISCMGSSLVPEWKGPSAVFLIPALPVIVALCLLRSYRLLSFTALIGDAAILLGTACVLLSGLSTLLSSPTLVSAVTLWPHPTSELLLRPSTFPLFLSTAAFLFCVHFFVLPIEANMQHPSHFDHAVDSSFLITAIANAAFGVLGLLLFPHPSAIILDNVRGSWWVAAIKGLLCVDMVFSYAVVFFPGREIVENALLGRDSPPSSPSLDRYAVASEDEQADSIIPLTTAAPTAPLASAHHVRVSGGASSATRWPFVSGPLSSLSMEGRRDVIRVSLVALTVVLAVSIPQFSVVLSLVGGLSMTALGFVFPPLMALRLRQWERAGNVGEEGDRLLPISQWRGVGLPKQGKAAEWMELAYYATLLCFGVLIMALTVVTSVASIAHALQSDAPLSSC